MAWHFKKTAEDAELSPGASPGGEAWSDTYKSFLEAKIAAQRYLEERRSALGREGAPAEAIERIKARQEALRKLTPADAPVELFSEATPEAALERAQHLVNRERMKRGRWLFIGLVVLALALMLVSLVGG